MAARNLWNVAFAIAAFPQSVISAEPVEVVAATVVTNPRQPQAAVDPQGAIYITFGADESIYCTKSTDRGQTFASPVLVDRVPRLALGLRRGPRIVAGHEGVVISAISHDGGNLLAWRSSDGGQNWQGPAQVNDSPRDCREGLHAMAIAPNDNVYCTWLDLRNGRTEIYGSRSTDGGETWKENRRVYRSPSGSVCECCHPAATFDRTGNLHVMWRNSVDGSRDLYVAASTDGGESFGAAQKLGAGTWNLDICPMDGGWLAAAEAGAVTTVWQRDKQVFKTDPRADREVRLGGGIQPWVAASTDGAYIVWIGARNGNLWLLTPDADQRRRLFVEATDPVIATQVTGEGPVVVAWESGRKGKTRILASVVSQ